MKELTITIIALLMLAGQGHAQNQKWSQNGRPGTRGLLGTVFGGDGKTLMDANGDGRPDVPSLTGQEYWAIRKAGAANEDMKTIDGVLIVTNSANPSETWSYPLNGLEGTKVRLMGFFNVNEDAAKEAILIGLAGDNTRLVLVVSQQGVQKVYSDYRLLGAGDFDKTDSDELLLFNMQEEKIELWGK